MSSEINHEVNLMLHIKGKYHYFPKHARPVANHSDAFEVKVGLDVYHVTLCEEDGMVEMGAYLIMYWKDDKLCWDPSKFGGLKNIRIPVEHIFLPDIGIERSGRSTYDKHERGNMACLDYQGNVLYFSQKNYRMQAEKQADGHYQLNVRVASWTYDSNRLALKFYKPDGITFDEFTQGSKWNVTNGGYEIKDREYDYGEFKEQFPAAKFVLDIKKKA